MTHTYSCIYFHMVWSTKKRKPMIDPKFRSDPYGYIAGIVCNKGGRLLEMGGMPDHVHLLLSLPVSLPVPELVRLIKVSSTKWVRQRDDAVPTFAWQEGYGAFSVSQSHVSRIRGYIKKQEEHHRVRSFKEEYIHFLSSAGIEYDKRFVFG